MLLYLKQTGSNCLMNRPDWAYFYLTNITFILFLNWIHFFVLGLADASSGGLAYARWDMLDINML